MLLDGGMGTMIQEHKLSEDDYRSELFNNHDSSLQGNNDLLSITQPTIIKDIHLKYLNAGSDIIETNTFNANSISQEDYNLQDKVFEMNFESAKIAREVVDKFNVEHNKQAFVCGSIGPTNRTASLSPKVEDLSYRNVTFDQLYDAYYEQIDGLVQGGIDIVMIETIFDTLNCKAAIIAVKDYFENKKISLPIMISVTIVEQEWENLVRTNIRSFLAYNKICKTFKCRN